MDAAMSADMEMVSQAADTKHAGIAGADTKDAVRQRASTVEADLTAMALGTTAADPPPVAVDPTAVMETTVAVTTVVVVRMVADAVNPNQ